jgi:hypothetical protein
VSREARTYALTKYTAINEKLLDKEGDEEVNKSPVYVNAEVDVVYRGKTPCEIEHAFAIEAAPHLRDGRIPVAFSKVLAVDLFTIIPYSLSSTARMCLRWGADEEEIKHFPKPKFFENRAADIVALAQNGVTEIIVVLDNNDNMTKFELCDLQLTEESWSPQEKGALQEVEKLNNMVHCAWQLLEDEDPDSIEGLSIPKITVRLKHPLTGSRC